MAQTVLTVLTQGVDSHWVMQSRDVGSVGDMLVVIRMGRAGRPVSP
jgi:hypothetical protein